MTSTVTAAAVSKNFGAYQDAAVREPVIITKNGRPRISATKISQRSRLRPWSRGTIISTSND